MAAAMIPLAISIAPLIPGLIAEVMKLVDVVRKHPDTPDAVKTQLDGIAASLADVQTQVAAAKLPELDQPPTQ
jgi:hypothetical protein